MSHSPAVESPAAAETPVPSPSSNVKAAAQQASAADAATARPAASPSRAAAKPAGARPGKAGGTPAAARQPTTAAPPPAATDPTPAVKAAGADADGTAEAAAPALGVTDAAMALAGLQAVTAPLVPAPPASLPALGEAVAPPAAALATLPDAPATATPATATAAAITPTQVTGPQLTGSQETGAQATLAGTAATERVQTPDLPPAVHAAAAASGSRADILFPALPSPTGAASPPSGDQVGAEQAVASQMAAQAASAAPRPPAAASGAATDAGKPVGRATGGASTSTAMAAKPAIIPGQGDATRSFSILAAAAGDSGTGAAEDEPSTQPALGEIAADPSMALDPPTPAPPGSPAPVASLAATASPAAAAPAIPLDQVGMTIKHAAKAGVGRIDITLAPEELGAVRVSLRFDDAGGATAHVTADRPETLTLLRQDQGSLVQALRDAGFESGDASVSFTLSGDASGGAADFAQSQQDNQAGGARAARTAYGSRTAPAAEPGEFAAGAATAGRTGTLRLYDLSI